MRREAAVPGVKAQRGDGMGTERVGSVKWALEEHWDQLKHLIPGRGDRRPGEMESLLNGEPKLE